MARQTKRAGKHARCSGCAEISRFTPLWDQAAYNDAFWVVHGYIAAGDIYQTNLTFPLPATPSTYSERLYAALAVVQPVQHEALTLQEGLPDILSRAQVVFSHQCAGADTDTSDGKHAAATLRTGARSRKP